MVGSDGVVVVAAVGDVETAVAAAEVDTAVVHVAVAAAAVGRTTHPC